MKKTIPVLLSLVSIHGSSAPSKLLPEHNDDPAASPLARGAPFRITQTTKPKKSFPKVEVPAADFGEMTKSEWFESGDYLTSPK